MADEKIGELIKQLENATGLAWNFDPAASGPRFRSFPGRFELVAYYYGPPYEWFLYGPMGRGPHHEIAEGGARSFDDAIAEMMLIYRRSAA